MSMVIESGLCPVTGFITGVEICVLPPQLQLIIQAVLKAVRRIHKVQIFLSHSYFRCYAEAKSTARAC